MKRWSTNGTAQLDTRYPWWIRRYADRLPNWLLNYFGKARRYGRG